MGELIILPKKIVSDKHFSAEELNAFHDLLKQYLYENSEYISAFFEDLDIEQTQDAILTLRNKLLSEFLETYSKEQIITAIKIGNIQYLMNFVYDTICNHPILISIDKMLNNISEKTQQAQYQENLNSLQKQKQDLENQINALALDSSSSARV